MKLFKNIQFAFLLFFILFVHPLYAQDGFALDIGEESNWASINDSLSETNLYFELQLFGELYTFDYGRLVELRNTVFNTLAYPDFAAFLDHVVERMEDDNIFLLDEDIIVNNWPFDGEMPFYEGDSDHDVRKLRAYSERVFLSNIKLTKPEQLLQRSGNLFVSPDPQIEEGRVSSDSVQAGAVKPAYFDTHNPFVWSLTLPPDNKSFFYTNLRQWFKLYEESPIYPFFTDQALFLRNEYRMFKIPYPLGKTVESFSPFYAEGYEHYQTYRSQNKNTFGYELYCDELYSIAELNGQLVVSDAASDDFDALWVKDLGEYSVCVQPTVIADRVCVGVINTRGEFWFIGFDVSTGDIAWSSFIGTSSFLTPASSLSLRFGTYLIGGSNHGVLSCIDATTGRIVWIKKYRPKIASLFHYWLNKYFEQYLTNVGKSPYDSQFLSINDEGTLFYKSRESDVVYGINPYSGEHVYELSNDSWRYVCLGVTGTTALYYEKKGKALVSLDLKNKEETSRIELDGEGPFRGFVSLSSDTFLVKRGDTIYSVLFRDGELSSPTALKGVFKSWLVYADGERIACADHFRVVVYDYSDDRAGENESIDASAIVRDTAFRDVSVQSEHDGERKRESRENIDVFSDDLSLLPLNVISNRDAIEVSLVLYSKDQLLCIAKDGTVQWERKLFYMPALNNKIKPIVIPSKGRLFAEDGGAFLIDNVLIIKDHVNVVACNVKTGEYLWSFSNSATDLMKERKRIVDRTLDDTVVRYGYSKSFVDTLKYSVFFVGETCVVSHRNTLSIVDPLTGARVKSLVLDLPGILDVVVGDEGVLYVQSSDNESIRVVSSLLERMQNVPVLTKDEESAFFKIYPYGTEHLVLSFDDEIRIVRLSDLAIVDVYRYSEKRYADVFFQGEYVFLVDFLGSITRVKIDADGTFGSVDVRTLGEQQTFRAKVRRNTQTHFVVDDTVFLFYRKHDVLNVSAITISDFSVEWTCALPDVTNPVHFITQGVEFGDSIYFVVSAEDSESFTSVNTKPHASADLYISSFLIGINKRTGVCGHNKALPVICELGYADARVQRFGGQLAYAFNGNHYIVEPPGDSDAK